MSTGQFLNSLPVIGSLFDNSDQDAINSIRQNQGLWGNLQTPDLKWNTYSPEQIAARSAQAQTVNDDPLAKSAQLSALNRMGDLAQNGLSAVDQQGYEQARELGNQMASSGSQAAMQNAQSRGLAGSGMEFANREIANQQGAQRAQQAGLQQAADSARQRVLYNQAYEQGMGNFRNQNTNLNAQNAGILNQFNMANTQAANNTQAMNVMNNNQAQQINNQGRINTQQQLFNDQLAKIGGETGANLGLSNAYANQNASNAAAGNNMVKTGAGLYQMFSGPKQPQQTNYNGQTNGGDSYTDFGSYA